MDSEDYYFILLILGLYPIFYFVLKWLFGNSIIFRIAFTFITVDIEISISCFIIGGLGIEHVFMWGLPLTLVCFGLAYWHIYRAVRLPLLDITADIARLTDGEVITVSERKLTNRKDEIGQIQLSLKEYGQAVSRTAEFAYQVQQGILSAQYKPLGPDDLLGNSLVEMNQSLAEVILETNKVVKSAAEEGVFALKLSTNKNQGAWRELTNSVNDLLSSLLVPIMEINRVIDSMALGDLTDHFLINSQGEMGHLATNLNTAIDKLKELIEEIRSVSLHLSSNTETLVDSNQEMTQNTNEIALTISQMSEGARHQLQQIDQSSKLVEHVMELSQDISSQSQEIFEFAQLGANEGRNGLKNMDTAVEAMKTLLDEASNAVSVLNKFQDRSKKISGIVNLIQTISQQTNLLSLNAAIEAGKAGDAGRGFTVVAEEIRQLASNTKASAAEIEQLISEVMNDTSSVLKHIQSIERIGSTSATSVFEASGTFNQMAQLSNQSLNHTETIQSNSQSQLEKMKAVVNAIEGVVVIAEETATGTDQVAASAAELSAGMTQFHQRFAALGDVSEQLKRQVNQFKLETSKKITDQ